MRAGFPGVTDSVKITDFTANYGTNVMTCAFFDFIILTLVMIFLAGFRHLIRQADAQQEWLGTLVFGVGLVYVSSLSLPTRCRPPQLSTPGPFPPTA